VVSARSVSAHWLISFAALALLVQSPENPARLFPRAVLGTTLFRAAWAYRHDRPWLERQLAYLGKHRFDAIRALGVVGKPNETDYWDGREIDSRWDDYAEVIAGLTDLAFDKYGVRVQWTIFGDAQKDTLSPADRARIVERFISMSGGREQKILAFEVANEFWQNGFDGADGLKELRTLSRRMRDATQIPVAASSHRPELCGFYADRVVDFTTVHFDRNAPHARWSPLVRPWRAERRAGAFSSCELPAAASNNEPLGPGSSVASTVEPIEIVMSAVNTYVAGIPIYILHTGPGVRDDPKHPAGLRPSHLDQLPRAGELFGGLAAVRNYLPGDLPTWTPSPSGSDSFPFELQVPADTVVLGAHQGQQFVVSLAGMESVVHLTARSAARVRSIDPLTGRVLFDRELRKADRLTVDRPAAVLMGTMTSSAP
jgi:hypothetical protein